VLVFLAGVVAIATLYFARVVFVPFVLALLFAFVLSPVVRVLDRLRCPRAASALIVVTMVMLGLGWLGAVVTGQLLDVANQLPEYRDTIQHKIDSFHSPKRESLNKAAAAVKEIEKQLAQAAPMAGGTGEAESSPRNSKAAKEPARAIPVEVVPPASGRLESLNGLIGPATTLGVVIVVTLFVLIRREDLRNRFIRLVGHGRLSVTTQALDDASQRVSRYLSLQLMVNVCFGAVVGAGLYFIGIPHALLWGVLAALFRFLPYIGGFVSAALPVLLSVAMFDGWTKPAETIGLYVVVEVVLANAIEPMLYGTHVGLSSLAILVAAIFWAALWGPVGLLLSTPLTVCLVVIGRYVPDLEFLNVMLGDEPVLAPETRFYQRLLAADPPEAKRVVENYLKENRVQQLYDLVLIPALALAEQDRNRNDLDETTERFVAEKTREIVEELYDYAEELPTPREMSGQDAEENAALARVPRGLAKTVVCVPAKNVADEIAGMMLAQLLGQAGHRCRNVAVGAVGEMANAAETAKAEVVFISAVQPFAIHAIRNLYQRLRANSPARRVVICLWGLTEELPQMSARMRLAEGDRIVVSLEQALSEMSGGAEAAARREEQEAKTAGTTADVPSQ
jgi:predicted PurR-regulated permease PerM